MSQHQTKWSKSKLTKVFEKLDLETQEKRGRFLHLTVGEPEGLKKVFFVTKLSNSSEPEHTMEVNHAKLEGNP